jgi:hypothetical protein
VTIASVSVVGCNVFSEVGSSVGCGVGLGVGSFVGHGVGSSVGCSVGSDVGASVGRIVNSGVVSNSGCSSDPMRVMISASDDSVSLPCVILQPSNSIPDNAQMHKSKQTAFPPVPFSRKPIIFRILHYKRQKAIEIS